MDEKFDIVNMYFTYIYFLHIVWELSDSKRKKTGLYMYVLMLDLLPNQLKRT